MLLQADSEVSHDFSPEIHQYVIDGIQDQSPRFHQGEVDENLRKK